MGLPKSAWPLPHWPLPHMYIPLLTDPAGRAVLLRVLSRQGSGGGLCAFWSQPGHCPLDFEG